MERLAGAAVGVFSSIGRIFFREGVGVKQGGNEKLALEDSNN